MALRVSLALTETSVAHLVVQGTLQKRERMEEPEDKAPRHSYDSHSQQQLQVTALGLP